MSAKTIGYRRVSGKIGLTANEAGARGAWVEKRLALWKSLDDRGYTVVPLSQFTKATAELFNGWRPEIVPTEILFLEFGGTNVVFNGKDWEETISIVRNHTGRIFFICDDPDLTFLWDRLPEEDWSRWTILVNAVEPENCRAVLNVPSEAKIFDYPAQYGMNSHSFAGSDSGKIVYLGRPNGRVKQIAKYLPYLSVAGKQSEWDKLNIEVIPQPSQSDRYNFYRRFTAAFTAFDNKHAQCGWRTGRAYHALYAGVPVLVPSRSNKALSWAIYASETEIADYAKADREALHKIWLDQMAFVQSETPDWEAIGL